MNELLVGRVNRLGGIVWSRGKETNYELQILMAKHEEAFVTKNNKLYVKKMDVSLNTYTLCLMDSAVKIAGTNYAFVLDNLGNDRQHSEFKYFYKCLNTRKFGGKAEYFIRAFSQYIDANAEVVAEVRDGTVLWTEDTWFLKINRQTLIEQYSRELHHFEILGNKIYYIQPRLALIEDLFFKCVEIAGDEERLIHLISYELHDNPKEYKKVAHRHRMAFARMSFSGTKFSYYLSIFLNFINDNDCYMGGLFSDRLKVC